LEIESNVEDETLLLGKIAKRRNSKPMKLFEQPKKSVVEEKGNRRKKRG